MRKLIRLAALALASVLIGVGVIVVNTPTAAAFSPISSWKWNTRNITVEDKDGRRARMEPGTYTEVHRIQRRVYIPAGCNGYWSTSVHGPAPLPGGRWTTLTYWRQHFGGRIYLVVPPKVPNRDQCNTA